MHYLVQAVDWLEPLTYVFGAGISFWAFCCCRKAGYLIIALYFCLAVFALLALPHIKAQLHARRTPPPSEETERKIGAAVSEAVDRVMREEGAQPTASARHIRFPFGPILLAVGVWLLARREARAGGSNAVSDTPKDEDSIKLKES